MSTVYQTDLIAWANEQAALTEREISLLTSVLQRHPGVVSATLFGSRAKGTHSPNSDVDLALHGLPLTGLQAQAIAAELDDLPLPLCFDVQKYEQITSAALREHITRVGVCIYRAKRHEPAHGATPS